MIGKIQAACRFTRIIALPRQQRQPDMPYMIDDIYHADWSIAAKGRWKAHARRNDDGWLIDDVSPVGDIPVFLQTLTKKAQNRTIWLGFDFPVGLCRAWYEKTGVKNFAAVLDWLESAGGHGFFDICDDRTHISPMRPFYPARSGSKGTVKRNHLTEGLGVADFTLLQRQCEKPSRHRGAAAIPFWTLGANQVGKAMLHGWRELVMPGRDRGFHLWPFDGNLAALSRQPGVTLIETYPAEIYGWLEIHKMHLASGRFAKSRQLSRRDVLAQLIPDLEKQGITLTPTVNAHIINGIDTAQGKDDAFDALIGVIGLAMIAMGQRAENLPDTSLICDQEGWIMGLDMAEQAK